MDKEKILSQNKKDNLYLDEYEKHIKLKGKSFGLMFVLQIPAHLTTHSAKS